MIYQIKYRFSIVKIAIVILICFSFSKAIAQQERNFAYYNNLTYRLYQEQKWDSLKQVASEAVDSGFDFYYMRMRLGYSFYAKNKFRLASKQFEKAMQFNSGDTSAMKLLYYSYLYGGSINEALYIAGEMPKGLKKRNRINTSPINSVNISGGFVYSDNIEKNSHYDFDGPPNILGEADLNDDIGFFHVGLSHKVSKWLNIYHGYSNVEINKMKILRIGNKDSVDHYFLKQNDYYICPSFTIKHKWNIAPAFHLLHDQWACIDKEIDSANHSYKIISTERSGYSYLFSLEVSGNFGIAYTAINGSYSRLNNANQYQAGVTLSIYPFANLNFYIAGSLQGVWMKRDPGQIMRGRGNNAVKNGKAVVQILAGTKITRFLWLEATASYGQMMNYNENNGAIVYNFNDKVNLRAGGNLIFPVNSHLDIKLLYLYLGNGSFYTTFLPTPGQVSPTEIKYNNHSITGGAIWKL
jgi:hypothetical protein